MDETRFYQKPGFSLIILGVISFFAYAAALYFQWREGTLILYTILRDLFILFALHLFWIAFFAQFVLPVHTFEERQKIFDRLMGYLGGMRGPAIFIKNGQAVDRPGESERKGAGVLWLDTASAVVTHVDVSLKHTFGPGVHFTGGGEKIAAAVSLHVQSQNIGPGEKDEPFRAKGENTSEDEFKEIQKRRMMTSALTRDGIEVVPNISVSFKIDADAIKGDRPGSHFGYSQEAVSRAIINQAVNPNAKPKTLEYNVDWNELPAYVAADLWREFMSKFKLMQLFEAECVVPTAIPQESPLPPAQDTEALKRPMTDRQQGTLARAITEMLHETNHWLEKLADRCEAGGGKKAVKAAAADVAARPAGGKPPDTSRKTALQVINFMLKERMTNPKSPVLNQNGEPQTGWRESREYRLLKERGIRVTSVSVSNLRFPSQVDEQITAKWTASWLDNARKEKERILSLQKLASLSGQEQAVRDYANYISINLAASNGKKETLKAIVLRSRDMLIRNDKIHRIANNELQNLTEILQWLEEN